MPRISALEFERLPLRVHAFLAGVPLHDIWAVDLPRIHQASRLMSFCEQECGLTDSRWSCARS